MVAGLGISISKIIRYLCALGLALVFGYSACAQGTFQNLIFESAIVPSLPSGQPAFIPFVDAFPGWNGITNPAAQAAYNGISVGAALLSIVDLHTSFYSNYVIQGNFTAVLQAGNVNPPETYGPAALFQVGEIPADANSLLFSAFAVAAGISNFFVRINGQNVAFSPLAVGSNFTEYGIDIAQLAGQTAEIRFVAEPGVNPFTTVFLDDIQFSDIIIPEPGVMALIALGGVALFWKKLKRCDSKSKIADSEG